jgi:hypothetical protein
VVYWSTAFGNPIGIGSGKTNGRRSVHWHGNLKLNLAAFPFLGSCNRAINRSVKLPKKIKSVNAAPTDIINP